MKYAFIDRNRRHWPISVLCEVLEVSPSGFHPRRQRAAQDKPQRSRVSDEALLAHIKAIHAEVKGEYGWPRMWKELVARSVRVGKERVRKLMVQHGVRARHKRKYIATTNSNHGLPVAPNLLERNFTAQAPNQVWTSDIPYLATAEGWLYLAVIIDLFSRQVVGWSMQPHMKAELVTDALRMAWFRRRPDAGMIVHSDRGSQYCSGLFQDTLKAYGMRSSMSRRGNCWECADRKPVGFAKGGAAARPAICDATCDDGRSHRLARLLQCPSAPFDIELRQLHDVREELGRPSARASGLIASAMGFVKQGQGHPASCGQHENFHVYSIWQIAVCEEDIHTRSAKASVLFL